MRAWLAAVSFAALGAAASHAWAQQASPAASSADAPTQVTITAKAGDPRNSTASKTVVRREDLTQYGDSNLGDALKRVPGVSVDSNGNIGLRGLGSGYTQVLINGEKAPPDFSIASLSPDSIDRIEITRTPTADMRGDAIAGTINIILRKSVHKRETELKLGTGEGRGQPELTAAGSFSDRKDHLSYVVSADLSHSGDVSSDAQILTATDPTGALSSINTINDLYRIKTDRASLTPNLTLTGDNGESTSLQGLLQWRRQDIFRGQTSDNLFGMPLPYADNPQSIVYDTDLERLDLDHSRALSDKISLKFKLSGTVMSRGGEVHQTGTDASGDLILDGTISSAIAQTSLASSGAVSIQVTSAHKLDLGWDGSDDWRYERRTEVDQPLPGALVSDSDDRLYSQVRRAAFYIQDNWTISDAWSAYLGLRDEEMDTLSHGTGYDAIHNRLQAVSPIVQALWKPDKADQIRFSVGRTFKAPDIAALVPRPYVDYNNTVFTPDGLGNPDLKPELAWGADASYEHDWSDSAMISVSAFRRDISGVILYQTLLENGRWVLTPMNVGNAEAEGLTLEGRVTLWGTDLHASVTKNASRVDSLSGPGNVLADQPPTQLNLDFERKFGKLWSAGGSYVFTQGVLAQQSAPEWAKSADTHEIDLHALRVLSSNLNLRFSLDDLLHRPSRGLQTYAVGPEIQTGETISSAVTTFRVNLEFKG